MFSQCGPQCSHNKVIHDHNNEHTKSVIVIQFGRRFTVWQGGILHWVVLETGGSEEINYHLLCSVSSYDDTYAHPELIGCLFNPSIKWQWSNVGSLRIITNVADTVYCRCINICICKDYEFWMLGNEQLLTMRIIIL